MLQMKVIRPKNINIKALHKELADEMKKIGKEIGKDFSATTKTWNHKPKFANEFEDGRNRIRVAASTGDKIYGYVSGGTRPHMIRPKRGKVLRFPGGKYRAKTSPGTIGSSSGGSSGAAVFSRGVRHPGTKARNFDETIAKKWERPFRKRINEAVKRAAKVSGHSI